MSLFDAVRSFLGIPPRVDSPQAQPRFWDFTFESNGNNKHSDEDFDPNMAPNREDFGFDMFSGNVIDMHRFFEQQFDDLLKGFQSNWFSEGFNHENRMLEPAEPESVNPRNRYLKPEYVQPPAPGSNQSSAQIDEELNQYVPPSRILDLFPDKGEEKKPSMLQPFTGSGWMQPFTGSRSVFSSQVIKKKMLPNGGIEEERRTVRDGKEETRVSRELDGMKHVLTTTKLPDGTKNILEEFVNMDQDKLPDFNKLWSKM